MLLQMLGRLRAVLRTGHLHASHRTAVAARTADGRLAACSLYVMPCLLRLAVTLRLTLQRLLLAQMLHNMLRRSALPQAVCRREAACCQDAHVLTSKLLPDQAYTAVINMKLELCSAAAAIL